VLMLLTLPDDMSYFYFETKKITIMINYPERKEFYQSYVVHTKRLAIAFLLLGLVGIFLPAFWGMTVSVFVGWLLFFLGLYTGFVTYKLQPKSVLGWLKALLLVVVGLLMVLNPFAGASALAVLIAVYLFVDAVLSFTLAFTLKPAVNKAWAVLNGLISTILGVIFLAYAPNPLASSWLLGLYVGINLLFDSLMLFQLSKGADKIVVGEMIA